MPTDCCGIPESNALKIYGIQMRRPSYRRFPDLFLIILSLVFTIVNGDLFGQIWPRKYLPSSGTHPYSVINYYDKGYLIGGRYLRSDGIPIWGMILKTDINGQLLWNKSIGTFNDGTGIFDINQTSDHGIIMGGITHETDTWGDPFVMKLNVCMEPEWCRIYNIGQNRTDAVFTVKQIPGGYVLYVFYGYPLNSAEKIHLFRLDNNGDLLWQQVYGNTDSLMTGNDSQDMTLTTNNQYVVSGSCYYPDSGTTEPRYLRPLIINVDSAGSMTWELPWRYVSGQHFNGMAQRSIEDNHHTLYSCGRHIEEQATPPGDRPTMLKTDADGNELSYHDPVSGTWQANFFNLNWFQDSTIEIDGGWINSPGGPGQIGVLKLDRNGNLLDSINVMQTYYCWTDAIVDKDNKVFLVQGLHNGAQWNSYGWKLNSNLEYDTLYTHPFVYDSLCPHAIPSDTIPLDCVVVGLDEPLKNPETGRLKIWPNPARELFHISIPDKLKTSDKTPFFNLTTVYHQWRSALVEVRDLTGRLVWSKEVTPGERTLDVNVSAWPAGMYAVRLVYNGRTAAVAVGVVRER